MRFWEWLKYQYNWMFRHCWWCGRVGVETHWVWSVCLWGYEEKLCDECHEKLWKIENNIK